MRSARDYYFAYLHQDPGSDFGVSFPDFPGCVTAGRTLAEAKRMAAEALALHIAGMADDGEPIPRPSTPADLARNADRAGAVVFLVAGPRPLHKRRVLVRSASARRSRRARSSRRREIA